MYKGKTVGVVVTAYDEDAFVGGVIETVPDFVDRIYAVDDASPDDSWDVIQEVAAEINARESVPPEVVAADGGPDLGSGVQAGGDADRDDRRVVPIRHEENRGYGGAVKTGYRRAAADGIDVVAVLNGDGQMDPDILDRIVDPVATGEADYAKGNRLLTAEDREGMSTFRFVGNAMLTGLSKFATGYWTIGDPQNGYTAISRETIESLDLESITDRYGFLNHILTHLNVDDRRVADVAMSAVYGDEESSIRYTTFVRFVSLLLLRSFLWRLERQYVVEGFHPAALFYATGATGLAGGVVGTLAACWRGARAEDSNALAGVLTGFVAVLLGLVALGIAIAMDATENEPLETTRYEYRGEAATSDEESAEQRGAHEDGCDPGEWTEPGTFDPHPDSSEAADGLAGEALE
ncbi:glycosyltransferase family 2 protein [Natrarchaeobaculum aegyptiacum]|uniref:Glycosyl transferase family 2 n=1 Tax=Natrarchaeobaculum aegyptiacum TaxID=745377 RepID=A0A2Z2HWR6_9EURY|nr:glycosyltransferase family 2 protein [Natrarchaeobaculum aegyptiacum]ARS91809.1 glycosyl transferase family 2 [Natrarchaeobaculum aegyptiacum]